MPLFSDQSISFAQIYITFVSLHFSDEYSQLIFMFWRSYVPISALLPYVVSISVTLFSLRFGRYFLYIRLPFTTGVLFLSFPILSHGSAAIRFLTFDLSYRVANFFVVQVLMPCDI